MPSLFSPFTIKSSTLRNRIVVSPMCQYSATDGIADDWHLSHLAGLARGGAALVFVEATGVSPEARITPGCLGLWNDAQAEALEPIIPAIAKAGAETGIQLAHAGPKASANTPWGGDDHIALDDPRGWQTLAASNVAPGGNLWRVPRAMTIEEIQATKENFVASTKRARDLGFKWLMLHFGHGYLASTFLSRHANQRTDQYGGSFENRCRFILETFAAVREVWPEDRPLAMRLGVIEFDGSDDETVGEAIELIRRLKQMGLDLIDVSIAFTSPAGRVPWGPALMASTATRVRRETSMPTAMSWYIDNPRQADTLIREGALDLAMIGRALLANPHWPFSAAVELSNGDPFSVLPEQYGWWLKRYRTNFVTAA